ncbi:hypothetical protein UFOVP95_49 [uncultured Caudovirales phage]|uniref:Uncharacterized protein n=1 Tax=uncultured Caudovirales phage TaxID=2100421 RepID=A0A6J5L2U4_9CAUD|nr:hypothetical protein UFOVP95_49 [uncultured Caudovirales phage]
MWGARSEELVDPSPFPLYKSPLVNNTLHILALVMVGLHSHVMVIMVFYRLSMSIMEFHRAWEWVVLDRSVYS